MDAIQVSKEMYQRSLVNQGNVHRLQKAFQKVQAGDHITVAFLGGSITKGCSAVPEPDKCYAGLTRDWFYETFGQDRVTYINAGIGATDSYLGVHRVNTDVLQYEPDLVFVEFSVNDERDINDESYESLLRRIYTYSSKPAVVLLGVTQRDGSDYHIIHEQIGSYYDFPIISYRHAILEELESGRILWTDIAKEEDQTHPANGGHYIIARLLIKYLSEVLKKEEIQQEMELKPARKVDQYALGTIINHTNYFPTQASNFEPVTISQAQFPYGWGTKVGGSITFSLVGKNFGIIFYGTQDGLSGRFEVLVDQEVVTTLDANFVGRWGSYADYVELKRFDEVGEHRIQIRKAEDSKQEQFTILGFTVS